MRGFRADDPAFTFCHGWSWYRLEHVLVSKDTGKRVDITMQGRVDSCHLDVWTSMTKHISSAPEFAFQWLDCKSLIICVDE